MKEKLTGAKDETQNGAGAKVQTSPWTCGAVTKKFSQASTQLATVAFVVEGDG